MSKGILRLILIVIISAVLVFVAVEGVPATKDSIGGVDGITLGLELKGGVSITYQTEEEDPSDDDMNDAQNKIRRRVDTINTESDVYRVGSNRICVDIPGADASVLDQIGKQGTVQFMDEDKNVLLDGTDILKAYGEAVSTEQGIDYQVALEFTDAGTKKFAEATENNIGKRILIVYDGEVVSDPVVQQKLTDGKASITRMGSIKAAKELASTIRIGAIRVNLEVLQYKEVGAKLGEDAIDNSILAGAIGLIFIAVFLIIAFRIPGVAGVISLLIYTAATIITLSIAKVTLTLPGIAGVVLSIGMAVDASIVIFARIREELSQGKTVRASINSGFRKTRSAIIDGNITTIIAGIVLYALGSGPIKGFAQTLIIGIILSMISSMIISKFILMTLYELGLKDKKLYGVQKERKPMGIISARKFTFTIASILIIVGLVFLPINKSKTGDILNYGIDFKGGTSIEVEFPDSVVADIDFFEEDIKPLVDSIVGNSQTQGQTVSDTNNLVIKATELTQEQVDKISEELKQKYNATVGDQETISATIGDEMKSSAIKAILIAAILMLIYIAIRFRDVVCAIGSIIALIHDVLIVLAVYAVLKVPVSNAFIACILTIVGYSINSSIVVFDRLRENRNFLKTASKSRQKQDENQMLVDMSVTQTLARSVYSSGTTFIVVFLLHIFGVAPIREFTLPLMVGIIAGAYSSVFIASPLWYTFKKFKKTTV